MTRVARSTMETGLTDRGDFSATTLVSRLRGRGGRKNSRNVDVGALSAMLLEELFQIIEIVEFKKRVQCVLFTVRMLPTKFSGTVKFLWSSQEFKIDINSKI